MAKEDIVPAGSFVPGQDGNQEPITPPAAAAAGSIPEKFAGKSAEEIAKSYTELEQKHGSAATELGALRQTVNILSEQLSKTNQAQGTTPTKVEQRNYDKEIADLAGKVASGDIDIAQALLQTSALTEEKTLGNAQRMMKEQSYNDKATALQQQFLKDNPDFLEMDKQGVFQQVWQEQPLLYGDKIGAFHAVKAAKANEELVTTKAALAEKDKIVQEQIRAGVKVADTVMNRPGQGARTPSTPGEPKNDQERAAGMLDVLTKLRGGGAS